MSGTRSAGVALLVLALAGCTDQTPTAVRSLEPDAPAAAKASTTSLLTNIPINQTIAGVGTLVGTLSLTSLGLQNGQLVGSGTLTGTITDLLGTVTQFTQTFTNVPLDLLGSGGACQVLDLDIGAIHLDLLGLVVDLAPVHLDIVAQSGAGNLLGNLLCAVTHLLDVGNLAGLLNILGQINNILAGL